MGLIAEHQKMVMEGVGRLVEKTDFGDITLERLARESGVSSFDTVRRCQSRENIVSSVLERELELITAAAHAPDLRMPGETLCDELHALARVISQEYRRRIPLLKKLQGESLSDAQAGALFYRTFILLGRWLFTELRNERRKLSELRGDLDVAAAAPVFLAASTGMKRVEVRKRSRASRRRPLARKHLRRFLLGLR